jgi:hypothetical protein
MMRSSGPVDWFVWFEIKSDQFFLSFIRAYCTGVDKKAIRWNSRVQFQPLPRASNSGQNGTSIDTRFDI